MLFKHINSILYIKPILKRKLDKIDVVYLPSQLGAKDGQSVSGQVETD
jgi:hypothetical protein